MAARRTRHLSAASRARAAATPPAGRRSDSRRARGGEAERRPWLPRPRRAPPQRRQRWECPATALRRRMTALCGCTRWLRQHRRAIPVAARYSTSLKTNRTTRVRPAPSATRSRSPGSGAEPRRHDAVHADSRHRQRDEAAQPTSVVVSGRAPATRTGMSRCGDVLRLSGLRRLRGRLVRIASTSGAGSDVGSHEKMPAPQVVLR